ncbi:hypothetical protein LP420_04040 [Massilia sp. B-10]|nr:hypothetical protein LP420_04040 [Massilia sp. B-10]
MTPFSTRLACLFTIGTVLASCAASSATFYANPASISNAQLCRTMRNTDPAAEPAFAADLRRAVAARGLSDASCQALVSKQNTTIAAATVIGAAIVGVASRSNNVGVGVGVGVGMDIGSGPERVSDTDWDWDEFSTPDRGRMWGCRGIQTGTLVDPSFCNGKVQTDWRWPQK